MRLVLIRINLLEIYSITHKMKFMITKTVYGTNYVSLHQCHEVDGNVHNMKRQLKSQSFVFMRGLRLPPTIYYGRVRLQFR
jgi:hypothetical protein